MTIRTQDEILARFESADDFLGWAREVLIEAMDADTVRRYNPDATIGTDWTAWSAGDVETNARNYLDFAIEKAINHRGLSAERSVAKLREFAWLLGRDDVVAAMGAAEYPQYGVPQVKAFADGMGWPFKAEQGWEQTALDRMAQGMPCADDCDEGCGQ